MTGKTSFISSYFFSLLSSLYLFSFGWLNRKNRTLIYQISENFGLKTYSDNPSLPKVHALDVVGKLEKIDLFEPIGVDGNVSTNELLVISSLIRKNGCKSIFEIGTFDGRTTLNMAANAPENAKVFTLDLPQNEMSSAKLEITKGDLPYIEKQASGLRFVGTEYADKISQLYGDSATFDFSPYHENIDFIFVDGSHSYSYVRSDTQHALKMCPDGIIVWHDYNMSCRGVIRALNEFQSSEPRLRNIFQVEGTSLVVLLPEKLRTKLQASTSAA